MEAVSVANLKQHLSHYLARVRDGEEVVVTAHRRPVARVIAEGDETAVRPPARPVRDLAKVQGVALPAAVDVVAVLLEDRARR